MEFALIILVAAATFGLCFLVDKGFQKTFRGKAQHRSGLSVRLNKKYGAFGVIFVALGIAAVFAGMNSQWVLTAGGGIVVLIGGFLIGYYMTFGIFYDEDSFLLTTFGKKSTVYAYRDIRHQQLYSSSSRRRSAERPSAKEMCKAYEQLYLSRLSTGKKRRSFSTTL